MATIHGIDGLSPEEVKEEIEQGARFAPAQIREPVAEKERATPERASPAEAARVAQPEVHKPGPERTRSR